jgi:archaellum component FlaC
MADLLKASIGVEFKGQAGINQAAAAIGKTEVALKKMVPASGEATQSLVNLSRVAQDAPYGFIGIANNINPLLESFQRLKASTGTTGGALKALGKELTGAGGIGLAVGVVSSLLVVFGDKLFGASKKAKEASEEVERLNKVLNETERTSGSVKLTAIGDTGGEVAKVQELAKVVQDQTRSYKERNNALIQLQSINKNYFGDLTLESDSLKGLTARVNEYSNALINAQIVKILSEDIGKLSIELSKATNDYNKFSDAFQKSKNTLENQGDYNDTKTIRAYNENLDLLKKQGATLTELSGRKLDLQKLLSQSINEGLKFKPLTANGGTVNVNPDKVNFKPFEGKIFSGDIEIIPPEEAKNQGLTFAEMFGKEVKDYFTKNDPTDFSLIKANKEYKIPVKYDFMGFKGLSETENDLAKIGEQIANTITPAFDAMVNAIGRGENAFKAFGDGVKQILIGVISKLVQTAILAATLSALFPGGLGGSKGFGSIFSKLLGFGGARAGGGPVGVGRTYLVGERGPELFTPGVSGNIVPNHRLGSVGSSFGGMQVSGVLVGRGNDLVAVINAAGRSNGRLV